MERICDTIKYWLVDHPMITNFEWQAGVTPAASLEFLILTCLSYLTFTFLFFHSKFPPLPPPLLRRILVVHNLILLLLSLTMAVGCTLSILSQMLAPHWIFCFPSNETPPRGPVFFWGYVFYLSKLLEFMDTFLILLSSSIGRLSFLHVYHHGMVPIICYIWLATSLSLFPTILVANASVHTVMYAYYLMCALGIRPSWKRLVTNIQIIQFVYIFLIAGPMFYYHFTKFPCSGIWGAILFNGVFNVTMLYLFMDFHSKNYNHKKLMK